MSTPNAPSIEIKVIGAQALIRKMNRLRGFFKSAELRRVLEDGKNAFVRRAGRLVPRRANSEYGTGLLASSISGTVDKFGTKDPTIRVGSWVKHAPHIEFGTRKNYPIRPRNKKVLFWTEYDNPQNRHRMKGAGLVFSFAKEVTHPGIKANPYLRPAAEEIRPRLMAAIERILDALFKRGDR